MKLIIRNASLEMQKLNLTTKEKTVSGAATPINIENFQNLRTKTKLIYKITVIDKGSWEGETIPFRFAKGSSSDLSNITAFLGDSIPVSAVNGAATSLSEREINFSNTTSYPDTQSYKISITTTDYITGEKAKRVLYKIEYNFV